MFLTDRSINALLNPPALKGDSHIDRQHPTNFHLFESEGKSSKTTAFALTWRRSGVAEVWLILLNSPSRAERPPVPPLDVFNHLTLLRGSHLLPLWSRKTDRMQRWSDQFPNGVGSVWKPLVFLDPAGACWAQSNQSGTHRTPPPIRLWKQCLVARQHTKSTHVKNNGLFESCCVSNR